MPTKKPIPEIQLRKRDQAPVREFDLVDLEELSSRMGQLDHNPRQLHRVNFFALLIYTGDKARHRVDFSTVELKTNDILIIARGQTHAFDPEATYKGHLVLFSEEFFGQYLLPSTLSIAQSLYHYYGEPMVYQYKPALETTFKRFQAELSTLEDDFSNQQIGALLTIFLLDLARQHPEEVLQSKSYSLFVAFKTLVEAGFKVSRDASHYANKLGVTYKHLNEISRKSVGKTAKAFIDDLILLEAKRLLASTSLSAKEIAFECGFEEPTNFVKFFKKGVGSTPMQFRKSQ